MAEETENNEPSQEEEAIRTEASEMGWVDKDAYKGNPDTWVDAKTFVEKGRHVLPILQKNNERLRNELGNVRKDYTKLEGLLKASQESIEALEEYHTEETNRRVEKARKDLLAGLKAAKASGNVDEEVDLTDELSRLNAAEAQAAGTEDKSKGGKPKPNGNGEDKTGEDFTLKPEFKQWASEHSWYGKDMRRTHLALGIAQEMREAGDTRVGKAFLDDVSAEVDKMLKGNGARPNGKVEGSKGPGNNRPSGKTFADLPADAKEACHKFSNRLVGPGRRYKTAADWEKDYANKYYERDQQ